MPDEYQDRLNAYGRSLLSAYPLDLADMTRDVTIHMDEGQAYSEYTADSAHIEVTVPVIIPESARHKCSQGGCAHTTLMMLTVDGQYMRTPDPVGDLATHRRFYFHDLGEVLRGILEVEVG